MCVDVVRAEEEVDSKAFEMPKALNFAIDVETVELGPGRACFSRK